MHSKDTAEEGDAAVVIPATAVSIDGCSAASSSIYDCISPRRRHVILLAAAFVSMLVPFSDTVYLPALQTIQTDLNTTQEPVAASVSIYMFMVGIASLVWGPASDRYGRRLVYLASFVAFAGSTVGCIFAPTVEVLVAFRALQGAGVAALATNGNAVVADIYPPSQRGTASGVYMISMLIGPVIGPLLGGALSEVFGWRSTFMALAAYAGLSVLLILVMVPETHQYKVLQRLEKQHSTAAAVVQERDAILAEPPVFHAPWVPLKYLLEPAICPHAVVAFVTFGCNFASLTETPNVLAMAPYSLSAGLIGVTFLSDGIPGLIGSPVGGWVSDYAAAKHLDVPEARLLHNTLCCLVTMPAGLLLYGWSLTFRTHLIAILVAQVLIGWACAVCLSGVFAFLTTMKQSAAAAASAAVQASTFISAGVLILASSAATKVIGYGPWFSALAGLQLIVTAIAYAQIRRKLRAAGVAARQGETSGGPSGATDGSFDTGPGLVHGHLA